MFIFSPTQRLERDFPRYLKKNVVARTLPNRLRIARVAKTQSRTEKFRFRLFSHTKSTLNSIFKLSLH